MQPTHDRADGHIHDLGDLLVGETFDVGEQHGHPELLGQGLERLLHHLVGDALEHLGLGGAPGLDRLEPAEAAEQEEVLAVVEVDLVGPALLRPVRVDEGVGEDLVEPGLEVGALLEPAEAAVGAQVRLLHEVLGVGRVARHAQRGRVQRGHVRHREFGELGPGRPCGQATHPGPLRFIAARSRASSSSIRTRARSGRCEAEALREVEARRSRRALAIASSSTASATTAMSERVRGVDHRST